MSTSREVLAELLASGMTKAEVARAVGRDSAVMSQIESGAKPYKNLTPTLEAIREQRSGRAVQVPSAPRRTTSSGQLAKVRQKTSYAQGKVVRVKKQGAASGGRAILRRLRQAAAAGLRIAFTVVYPHSVTLGKSGGRDNPKSERDVAIDLGFGGAHQGAGHAEDWVERAEDHDGDVGEALSAYIAENDLGDTEGVTPLGIELRTW